MTVVNEAAHAAEFILWEEDGQYSRENGIVASGQTLAAGEVIMLSAGKLVAHDGALDSNLDVITAAVGIIIAAITTTADTPAAYLKREATVNVNLLTFPTETSPGGEQAAVTASLAALGILVR